MASPNTTGPARPANVAPTPNHGRRALLRLAAFLGPLAGIPAAAAASMPAAVVLPERSATASAAPPKKDWSRLAPGYDPDPIPVGTRCLYDGREVTIAAGPINPEPDVWENPSPWYAVDAPWIDESYARMEIAAREAIARNDKRIARLQRFIAQCDSLHRRNRARGVVGELRGDSAGRMICCRGWSPVAVNRRELTIL